MSPADGPGYTVGRARPTDGVWARHWYDGVWKSTGFGPYREPADDLPDPVAHLGQGTTAYAALSRVAPVRPGDVVFVSGGAGAVGSMAGQVARLLGASRVIGSTGSAAKTSWMTDELGYDAVVVRGARPLADQLAEAAPEGLDVVADTVSGEDLQAAIATARVGGRFALVGALAGQLGPGASTTSPIEFDAFQIIIKQLTLRGYSGGHDPQLVREWRQRFASWLRAGEIKFPHTLVPGITAAPQALEDLVTGRYQGAVIVAL